MSRAAAVLLVVCLGAMAGCFGGEARTQWAFSTTQLDQVAALGRTGEGVTVAILDTGIDPHHVALRHLIDGDPANGELVGFKDFISGNSGVGAAYDDEGHGTHVAGIIAAQGSSLSDKLEYQGVSLLGGAPHVRLLVARVCYAAQGGGTCDGSKLAPAVDWATQNGAQVVSMSLGGVETGNLLGLNPSDVERSIDNAIAQGVVVVAAAGNTCKPGDDPHCQQACQDVEFPSTVKGVIAVGAIAEDGQVTDFSCHGDDAGHPCSGLGPLDQLQQGRCDPDKKPELVAPGDLILSSWIGGKYVQASGTSQATPFVTATVALMLQGHDALRTTADVEALKQALRGTARPLPGTTGHSDVSGYGVVQARAALAAYDHV